MEFSSMPDEMGLGSAAAGGRSVRRLHGLTAHQSEAAQALLQTFPEERSEDDLDVIHAYIQSLPAACRRFFNLSAPKNNVRYLCKHLKLLTPGRGTLIYRQGEVGDKFYVIVEGVCEVMHAPVASLVDVSGGAAKRKIGETGECFGENSIGRERDASVLCNGHTVGDTSYPAKVLQVDGRAYRKCIQIMFHTVEAVLRRRSARLRRLDLFADWPASEAEFFSYWMKEITYEAGSVVYNAGDPVEYVYFMTSGVVNLSIRTDKKPGVDFVVEQVAAPSFFGELEVVEHYEERQHKVTVADKPVVMAAMPVNVFWRLMLSDEPARVYRSAFKLEKLVAARVSWHQLRVDDIEDTGDVHHALLHEIQTRFLGCPLCGEMNHMLEDCPKVDGTTLPPGEGGGAALAAGASADSGSSSSPAASKPSTPKAGAALVARRNLGLDGRGGSPSSRPGSRGSLSPTGSPTGTPRSGRRGTPRPLGSGGGPVEGDDWNDVKVEETKTDKLDASAKLFLQEARADIRSVLKAVQAFKRLVARRRAERAAAEGGEGGTTGPATAAAASAARRRSGVGESKAANSTGAGGGAGAGGAFSTIQITPIKFEGEMLSGSLARPRHMRKSKSVGDIPPIRSSKSRRSLNTSMSLDGGGVSSSKHLLSPTFSSRFNRKSSKRNVEGGVLPGASLLGRKKSSFKSTTSS